MSLEISVALFVALLAAFTLLVLTPILRRASKSSVRTILASTAVCFAVSLALYTMLGSSADMRISEMYLQMSEKVARGESITEQDRAELLQAVEERAQSTDSADYWYILAGHYRGAGDLDSALPAYARAGELRPEDPTVLAEWAETGFIHAGYQLTEQVQQLTERVLALDPNNQTILGVLGISAFQVGEYQIAIDFWQRALTTMPYASSSAEMLRVSMARAEELLAQESNEQQQPAPETGVSEGIELQIELAPEFTAPEQTIVFVLARVPGTPMPLAVTRISIADLANSVVLDDSLAMIPGTSLASFAQLEIVARVSFSGQPAAVAGDFEGVLLLGEEAFTQAHRLIIDRRIED